jgi:2Fe-2S ferredoxin
MPEITFIDPNGAVHLLQCENGRSLMRAAVHAGVPGVVAECGGCMTCGTCHVHLDAETFALLPEPSDDEEAMLDILIDRDPTSRLSCQVRISEALAGATVRVSKNNG